MKKQKSEPIVYFDKMPDEMNYSPALISALVDLIEEEARRNLAAKKLTIKEAKGKPENAIRQLES